MPLVEPEADGIRGEVWWIDQFGNAQTNIAPADLEELDLEPGDDVSVRLGAVDHDLTWVAAYGDVEPAAALLHVDSYGLVALAVREGSAAERMSLAPGVQVVVRRPG